VKLRAGRRKGLREKGSNHGLQNSLEGVIGRTMEDLERKEVARNREQGFRSMEKSYEHGRETGFRL